MLMRKKKMKTQNYCYKISFNYFIYFLLFRQKQKQNKIKIHDCGQGCLRKNSRFTFCKVGKAGNYETDLPERSFTRSWFRH